MQLDARVCVLTGATGGIGRTLARALAECGVRLILTARDRRALDDLAAMLPDGCVADVCPGDLTRADHREVLAERAERLDAGILVNLFGANRFGLLAAQSEHDVQALLSVNLVAPIALTQRLLPHLQRRKESLVVNVGSAFDAIGFPGYVLYSASKFGLRGFSEALGRELADSPVAVVHIAPRATRTPMNTPAVSAMNRALGNTEDPPERVAARIVAAMRTGRRRSSIGYRERWFARINRTLPVLVDHVLARQLATIKHFAASATREELAP